MESPGINKYDRLPDVLALILLALMAVWAFRQQAYGGLIPFAIVTLIWWFRLRKSPRLPDGPEGLTLTVIAGFFAGPYVIVLVGIFRPQITFPTALAVVAVYAVLLVFGALVRLRARPTPHNSR